MVWKRLDLCRPARLLRRLRRNAAGQSLLEFALILPALILILLGIIQFGAVFTGLLALNAAAREGARQAAVAWHGDDSREKIEAAVERVYKLGLFMDELDPQDIKIEFLDDDGNDGDPAAGKAVRVTVSGEVLQFVPLPFHQESPVENPEEYSFESPLKLSVTSVMRLEKPAELAPEP
jgi:hypothetical protein